MKLSDLRSIPAEITIRHPLTNEPLTFEDQPVQLSVVSSDSKAFHIAQYETQVAMKKKFLETKVEPTDAEQVSAVYELLCSCVVGWNKAATSFFEEEFTPEGARKFLADPDLFWLAKQVENSLADKSKFFPKPSETPA